MTARRNREARSERIRSFRFLLLLVHGLAGGLGSCTVVNSLDRYQAGGPPLPPDAGASDTTAAGPSWRRYSYNFSTETWSEPILLSDDWRGPNAPPPRDIAEALELAESDRLLVFGENGMFHLRVDGNWQPPEPISARFGPLSAAPFAGYVIPHKWSAFLDPKAPDEDTITLVRNPTAYLYQYRRNDTIAYTTSTPIPADDGGPGPDRRPYWSFEVVDLGNAEPASRYRVLGQYDDDRLYELRADLVWRSTPIEESPMWKGKPNAAPIRGLAAAYFTDKTRTANFIGP